MPDETRQVLLATALTGMITGALIEAFNEISKELRRYAGGDFDKRLDALEIRAIRSVENAALDGISEHEQLFLVEHTRKMIAGVFRGARDG